MREIKFRAKHLNRDKFVYGDLVIKCSVPHIVTSPGVLVGININTVGQFTGLYDKNGTEIYEGDIIKAKTYFYGKEKEIIYEIKFDDDIENDSFGEPLTIGYCLLGSEYEVIGNIYDNPEIIKEKSC